MLTRSKQRRTSEDEPVLYSIPALEKVRKKILYALKVKLLLAGRTFTLPVLEKTADWIVAMELDDGAETTLMFQDDPTYALEELESVKDIYSARKKAVHSILSSYIGELITDEIIAQIAVIMSGWWEELSAGLVRPAWSGVDPQWAPIFVHDLYRLPCKGRMHRLSVKSYAGVTAGTCWEPMISGGGLQMLIRDAKCRKYDEYHDMDAAGLWFTARVCVQAGSIRFQSICASSSQERYNKDLQAGRRAVCSGPCQNLRGKALCQMCPVSTAQCTNARSQQGYTEVRGCRGNHKGLFRPDIDTNGWCLACLQSGRCHNVKRTS